MTDTRRRSERPCERDEPVRAMDEPVMAAGLGIQRGSVPVDLPPCTPAPPSAKPAPDALDQSAVLLIIVLGMAGITLAGAFVLTVL